MKVLDNTIIPTPIRNERGTLIDRLFLGCLLLLGTATFALAAYAMALVL